MRSPLGTLLSAGSLQRVLSLAARAPVPVGPNFAGRAGNLTLGVLGRGPWDDEKLMRGYSSVGTLFAVVNRLAVSTASAEWKLWRKAPSGLKDDRIEVTKHAALDLWNNPNPFMPRQEYVETAQQHVDLVGESSSVIGYGFGIPLEMWPVRPDRITPVPDPYEFIKGYMYRGPEGQQVPLALNECKQVKMPNPLDPYRGLGPVQSILTDLDSVRFSAEWNKNFFLNSAEPGGIIEVEKRLGDDEFDEMSLRWNEQHRGVSKAHRVAIIEQGKWKDRAFSQRDMQFVELSRVGDDKIREAFGFPKFAQGIVEDVNRASAEASEYLYSRWLIIPRLDRWKAFLNSDILPLFGKTAEGLEFDYESPVSENSEEANSALTARWEAVAKAVPLGFDPAEVLASVGLPPLAFTKPEPQPQHIIQTQPGQNLPPGKKAPDEEKAFKDLQKTFMAWIENVAMGEITAAQKWVAVEHVDDDSTCEPCRENHGKTYKNRQEAYEDYPDGKGFKDCVGAEFGNECRGKVVKRKADNDDD